MKQIWHSKGDDVRPNSGRSQYLESHRRIIKSHLPSNRKSLRLFCRWNGGRSNWEAAQTELIFPPTSRTGSQALVKLRAARVELYWMGKQPRTTLHTLPLVSNDPPHALAKLAASGISIFPYAREFLHVELAAWEVGIPPYPRRGGSRHIPGVGGGIAR